MDFEPTNQEKICTREDLKQVIQSSYDAIFVTDGQGYVLLCNPATGKMLNVNSKDLVGKSINDILKKGIYDRSMALEAIRTGTVANGLIINRDGKRIMATATPILDENGNIIIVVVNSRDERVIEKYIKALDEARNKSYRYKTAAEYLNQRNLDSYCIIAESEKMKQIIDKCSLTAKTDSTIVLMGESGTGKEIMARFIHQNSNRVKEPFIPVNCTAIPAQLLESEFFGYVNGAYTGANPKGKPGLFEVAHKGTLFLDEIGDLPLDMQPKLLRIIETGEVQRLGSTDLFKTNVRIIAATNRDLYALVVKGKFRSDLYYRLNVIPVLLPPLRERPEDILALAELFLAQFNKKYALKKEFTSECRITMLNYNWPGNVRELRNVVERLVVTSIGQYLDFENDLLMNSRTSSHSDTVVRPTPRQYRGTLKNVLREVEEEYISQVLDQCNGHIGKAAERLGIHRTMLYRKMKANENVENKVSVMSSTDNEH